MPHNRRIKRYNPNSKKYRFRLIAALLIILILYFTIDANFRPYIKNLATATAENLAIQSIDRAVADVLTNEKIVYSDLAIVEKNTNGVITSIKIDTVKTNLLKSKIVIEIQKRIASIKGHNVSIPFGSLFGKEYLAGRGPYINIKISMTGIANSKISNKFESAGINQTLHRIMLDISAKIYIVLPNNTSYTTVNTNICIAETVIVGSVPNTIMPFNPYVVEQK
ncbi:MAG: sporulation protein YunB [Clostridiales bacterium]|nr:sporulation protein YunB [Clostridiales bacterium]